MTKESAVPAMSMQRSLTSSPSMENWTRCWVGYTKIRSNFFQQVPHHIKVRDQRRAGINQMLLAFKEAHPHKRPFAGFDGIAIQHPVYPPSSVAFQIRVSGTVGRMFRD